LKALHNAAEQAIATMPRFDGRKRREHMKKKVLYVQRGKSQAHENSCIEQNGIAFYVYIYYEFLLVLVAGVGAF